MASSALARQGVCSSSTAAPHQGIPPRPIQAFRPSLCSSRRRATVVHAVELASIAGEVALVVPNFQQVIDVGEAATPLLTFSFGAIAFFAGLSAASNNGQQQQRGGRRPGGGGGGLVSRGYGDLHPEDVNALAHELDRSRRELQELQTEVVMSRREMRREMRELHDLMLLGLVGDKAKGPVLDILVNQAEPKQLGSGGGGAAPKASSSSSKGGAASFSELFE